FNYWRGVREALGARALTGWVQEGPDFDGVGARAPTLDLSAMPMESELSRILLEGTAKGLVLTFDVIEVLVLPPDAGAEPLNERHIRSALRRMPKEQFIPPLALKLVRDAGGGPVF